MSHVKSGGAVAQTKNMVGKRLGFKYYDGEVVKNGTIIVKQRGSISHPGKNTKMSKDFSIYAVMDGVVKTRKMSGTKRGKFYIDVIPTETEKAPAKK